MGGLAPRGGLCRSLQGPRKLSAPGLAREGRGVLMDGTGAAAAFVCSLLRALSGTGRVRPPPGKRAAFFIPDSGSRVPHN